MHEARETDDKEHNETEYDHRGQGNVISVGERRALGTGVKCRTCSGSGGASATEVSRRTDETRGDSRAVIAGRTYKVL